MHSLERDAREVLARWDRGDLAEAVRALSAALELIALDRETRARKIDLARKEYAGDDIEIDDQPLVAAGDDGIWVQAWIWMPRQLGKGDGDQADEAAERQRGPRSTPRG